MAEAILDAVGASQVAYLSHDAYYRDMSPMALEERARLNYDHPDSLETELLIEHVQKLLTKEPVEMPIYDFTSHRRTGEIRLIDPAPIVLIDGILIFTNAILRDLMDIKVYVDTDADIRFIRRMQRDMNERGRSLESIIAQYMDTVRLMHLEFVEPSKRYADVIVPHGGLNQVAMGMVVSRLLALLQLQEDIH